MKSFVIILGLLGCLVAASTGTTGTCNECNKLNNFACISANQLQACNLKTKVPEGEISTCPQGYQCVNTKGCPATCLLKSADITDCQEPTKSQLFCRKNNLEGNFAVGKNAADTCRLYYHCKLNDGVWTSGLYQCPEHNYFNSQTGLCQKQLPSDCVCAH